MHGYDWPKIVWTARRSGLPTDDGVAQPVTNCPTAVYREYSLGPTTFVRALHWSELRQVYPFTARFFQVPDLVSSFHQHSVFQNRLFPRPLRRKVAPLPFFLWILCQIDLFLQQALTLTKQNNTAHGGIKFLRNVGTTPLYRTYTVIWEMPTLRVWTFVSCPCFNLPTNISCG